MEVISLVILYFAFKAMITDTRKAWGTSKAAYMRSADARFPSAPKRRRALWALRHDAGYWAAQASRAFPSARHGFAAGWHAGHGEAQQRRASREEARARRLEDTADAAPQVDAYRRRQRRAQDRMRDARRPAGAQARPPQSEPATDPAQGTGAGSAGNGEGSGADGTPGRGRTAGEPDGGSPGADEERPRSSDGCLGTDGRTYSYGSAVHPYPWLTGGDADEAHYYAQRRSMDGKQQVVTEYPPGGGPGKTVATYLNGEQIQPTGEQQAAWDAEADERRRQWAPKAAGTAAAEDDAPKPATEDKEEKEEQAGQSEQTAEPSVPPQSPQPEGETMAAADVSYDGVTRSMAAAKDEAEQRAAEQAKAASDAEATGADQARSAREASEAADAMQALRVDPATLSAMAEHLEAQDKAIQAQQEVQEAHDKATKAQQRVQESAEAVEAALNAHAGLNAAHQEAPVVAADREFYAEG
jgi:hypothetical protein